MAQQNNTMDIFSAIRQNNKVLVEEILQQNPLQINRKNSNGATPLHMAVSVKNLEIANLLLEKGALVNCGDSNLRAPIHFANWNADTLMINLLLEYGGVIDTRAIGAASPLIHSSLNNNYDMSKFLIRKGADINLQCNSLTVPLYFAVLNNNMEYLDYLMNKGAEIDIPDFLGRTPLYIAVRDGNTDVVKKLITNGASVNTKDNYLGRGLIHIASIEGHSEVVEILFDHKVNINEPDNSGFIPTDLAIKYGNKSTEKFLRENGGKTIKKQNQVEAQSTNGKQSSQNYLEVIKLQNGSWAINTECSIIILGYSEIGAEPDNMSLQNGHITEEILQLKKNIYIVDCDFHPVKSRFSLTGSNPLLQIFKNSENVHFILNPAFDKSYGQYQLKNVHYPKPSESITIGNLKLSVLRSYGINLCYILELDGKSFVWLTGICDNYVTARRDTEVVLKLKEKGIKPDLLFLGSPAGIGPEYAHGIRETYIETLNLNPENVFVFGHELLESKVFYQLNRMQNNSGNLHTAENPGDRFKILP